MTTFKDLKVGDRVFIVEAGSRQKNPRYVTVDKVGRKFIYLDIGTYHKQQAVAWDYNGYAIANSNDFPQCHVYATQEDYEAHLLWDKVRNELNHLGSTNTISRKTRDLITKILKEELDL